MKIEIKRWGDNGLYTEGQMLVNGKMAILPFTNIWPSVYRPLSPQRLISIFIFIQFPNFSIFPFFNISISHPPSIRKVLASLGQGVMTEGDADVGGK